jgi:virulence factor Mce-like protein
VIIAPTMVSDRFVQMTEPWVKSEGGPKLSSGTVIDRDHTAIPVEIDDLYAGLKDMADALGPKGANKNGALARLIKVGAANLDGQGENLNVMIREFGKASATLSDVDENFFAMLVNLDKLNTMLVDNDSAVAEVSTQFADVAGFLADDREDMGKMAKNLSGAMAVLDDFIQKNRANLETSVEQLVPTAQALTKHQKSLDEMIKLAPLLLHNLDDAYDPAYGVIAARGNVNEVSLWSKDGLTARTSSKAPPTMLSGTNPGDPIEERRR